MNNILSIVPDPDSSTAPLVAPLTEAAELAHYLPLVTGAVSRFLRRLPPNVLREDLIAAGAHGLLDALRKDRTRGGSFTRYARTRIEGAIVDELRREDWFTRSLRKEIQAETLRSGRCSLAIVGFDDLADSAPLGDDLTPSPFTSASRGAEHCALMDAIAQLPTRERMIVSLHYFEEVSVTEIAAQLRVSQPRVSQLLARGVQTLKALLGPLSEQAA